jgi:hypothetical protein
MINICKQVQKDEDSKNYLLTTTLGEVGMYICTYVCIHVYINKHIHRYTYIYMHIKLSIYINLPMKVASSKFIQQLLSWGRYVDFLTCAFGWYAFLRRIRFRDTLVIIFFK